MLTLKFYVTVGISNVEYLKKVFKFINKHFGLKFEKKTEDFFFERAYDFFSE